MEGTPTYLDYNEMQEIFLGIDGVRRVHNLRIWGLSINKVALSAHLAIGRLNIILYCLARNHIYVLCFTLDITADPDSILHTALTAVHARYSLFETTLQIERFQPGMEACDQCTDPLV